MTTSSVQVPVVLEAYFRTWADTVASVLGQIAAAEFGGQTLSLDWTGTSAPETSSAPAAAEAPVGPASAVFLNTTLAGALRGEQVFGLAVPVARWLAQTFVGEPTSDPAPDPSSEPPAELSSDHRDALEELFRQVAGLMVTALKPKWGEVQIHVQAGAAPTWPSAVAAWVRSPEGVRPPLAIEMRVSAALAAAVRTAETQPAVAATGAAPAPASTPAKEAAEAVNLDLLRNVPLDLTLRFGGRRMLLREIMELGAGSVIELDRRLKDPVDLLLDGRVLARGEVVVIQGHYGLRVTEIAKAGGADK